MLAQRLSRDGIVLDGAPKQVQLFQEKLASVEMKKKQSRPGVEQKQIVSGAYGILIRPATITGHRSESMYQGFCSVHMQKPKAVIWLAKIQEDWKKLYLLTKAFRDPQLGQQIRELKVFTLTMLFLLSVPGDEFEADEEIPIRSAVKLTKNTGKLVYDDTEAKFESSGAKNDRTPFSNLLDETISQTIGFAGLHA